MPDALLLAGVAILAVGTYLTRIIGVIAGRRRALRAAARAAGPAAAGPAPADAAAPDASDRASAAPADVTDGTEAGASGAAYADTDGDATPARLRRSDLLVVVLLAAVALTGAVFDGAEPAGWARIAGVAVGAACAAFRRPLAVVIIAAAATTALLRLAGVA